VVRESRIRDAFTYRVDINVIEKGTISIGLVQEALQCPAVAELDTAALLAKANVAPQLLGSPRARVSPRQYAALWNAIAQALDDEFFGQDSHPMRRGSFVAMCRSALSARDGAQALERTLGFMRLVLDDFTVRHEVEGDALRLSFALREHVVAKPMFAYATYFILVYGVVCWLVGRRIAVRAARFACDEPRCGPEYRAMLCDALRFGSDDSCVELSANFLSLPVIQDARSLTRFLRDAPANFLVKYRHPHSVAARIRRALRSTRTVEWPHADDMARMLKLAAPTLRRRLQREGTSYQAIKDDLRRDLAIAELQRGTLTIAEVAEKVGFAEPSAFHRAFRRWTGARPTDYRTSDAPPR
jgi:AraC-like DNA-binding protein